MHRQKSKLIKKPLPRFMKDMCLDGYNLSSCYIAGGAVREYVNGQMYAINDIDIFGTTKNIEKFLENNRSKITVLNKSPLGTLNVALEGVSTPVQLITTECAGSVSNLLSDFDIRMCRFACDGVVSYYDVKALEDLKNKEIVISSYHTPFLTLTRLVKYCNRGYNINSRTYRALLLTFHSEVTPEVIKAQIELISACEYDGETEWK